MSMRILSAKFEGGEEIPAEQINADVPRLRKLHKEALKDDPTWEFFGGTITLDKTRHYQLFNE
jgi:hypothetical protein